MLLFLSPAFFCAAEGAKSGKPFAYIHDEIPDLPLSIHICKIERGNNSFEFYTTLGKGATMGMSTVSEQIKAIPPALGIPIAAINGDFYQKEETIGDPRDLQIRLGELVSGPAGHSCFWMDARGNPQMTNVNSRFRIVLPEGQEIPFELNSAREKDTVVLYTHAFGESTRSSDGLEFILEPSTKNWLPLRAGKTYPAKVHALSNSNTPIGTGLMVLSIGPKVLEPFKTLKAGSLLQIVTETIPDVSGSSMAVAGGPALVRNGKAMEFTGIQPRHPRAAIGWNKDHFFLVQVDGRQSQSVGMTLGELGEYMVKLGCEFALNFDGGGSATMWVMGNVMNSPSEGQERPAANALVVLKKKKNSEPPLRLSASGSGDEGK